MEIYADTDGDELVIGRQGPGAVFLVTPPGGIAVEGTDLPGVFAQMCEAAGIEVPAILARPDLHLTRSFRVLALLAEATPGGGVRFSVGGSAECLSPDGARRVAAALVALADLAEARA